MSNTATTSGTVTLPVGVTISPGRESVATGPTGASQQGMIFTLTLPSGANTSVFIPYTLMTDLPTVSQMFADRIAAIQGVTALASSD